MSPTENGFVYLVRNANGREFIYTATFSVTRTKAKKLLSYMQNQRCLKHRPMLEVVALCEAKLTYTPIQDVA